MWGTWSGVRSQHLLKCLFQSKDSKSLMYDWNVKIYFAPLGAGDTSMYTEVLLMQAIPAKLRQSKSLSAYTATLLRYWNQYIVFLRFLPVPMVRYKLLQRLEQFLYLNSLNWIKWLYEKSWSLSETFAAAIFHLSPRRQFIYPRIDKTSVIKHG